MKRFLLTILILCLFVPVSIADTETKMQSPLTSLFPAFEYGEYNNDATLKIYRIDDKDGHTAGRIIETGSTKYIYDKNGKHLGSIRKVN